MKYWPLLLLLSGCAYNPKPVGVDYGPVVANNLHFLYNHLQTEFAFCVFGEVQNDVIMIDHLELPFITSATATTVQYFNCRGRKFLGMGHSHPSVVIPGTNCDLSEVDEDSLVQTNAPFEFLLCDMGLTWFTREEVRVKRGVK